MKFRNDMLNSLVYWLLVIESVIGKVVVTHMKAHSSHGAVVSEHFSMCSLNLKRQ